MELTLSWWALVSLGVALMIAELFIGAFIVLWFGIGAVATGLLGLVVDDMNLGVQILLASLIGVVLMYFFRDRYVAKQNASQEELGTFRATTGKLFISESGQHTVFANGTYWQIGNLHDLPKDQRIDGHDVDIVEFRNNKAILKTSANPEPA